MFSRSSRASNAARSASESGRTRAYPDLANPYTLWVAAHDLVKPL